jgi:hypothetical protein
MMQALAPVALKRWPMKEREVGVGVAKEQFNEFVGHRFRREII